MSRKSKKEEAKKNDAEIDEFFSKFDELSDNFASSKNDESESTKDKASEKESSKSAAVAAASEVGDKKNKKGVKASAASAGAGEAMGKREKKLKKKRSLAKRIFLIIGIIILAMFIAFAIYAGTVISQAQDINPNNIYSRLSQTSTIYDADGNEIENVFVSGGNRTNVDYNRIPKNLINAVVSIEDKTFWDHHGFNFVRIFGAVKESIFGGGQISGTSTITQQLARNVYLSEKKSERSLDRKISEAYYAILIEKNLTKEQIVEAYLNTIYLGYDCYGVQTAAERYFSKDVEDLDLLECASLAALPKSPDSYALVRAVDKGSVNKGDEDIIKSVDNTTYIYNGKISQDRRETTLKNMLNQKLITKDQYDSAMDEKLKTQIKLSTEKVSSYATYFTDYVIETLSKDIMKEYNYNYEDAKKMVYTGGLKIYTTMKPKLQKVIIKEFSSNANYPSITNINMDDEGNILNDNGNVMLYDYNDYFDDEGTFTLHKGEYKKNDDGSIIIKAGKRLKIYETTSGDTTDYNLDFKPMYLYEDGTYYTIENGTLSIPAQYKKRDSDGNITVSAEFIKEIKPDFFDKRGSSLEIGSDNYTIKQKVVQPQSAMTIMNNDNGTVVAMVGGRNTEGKKLYNRCLSTRQPGSSIKPLSVYSAALQTGYEAVKDKKTQSFSAEGNYYGDYWTAASEIKDAPMYVNGKLWPKNAYNGFKGYQTLRKSVEQSINVNAVKVYQEVGPEFAVSQLKKFGITSVVEEGNVNDLNPAALALGGMTKGISPLEMTAAYSTFPNQGTYTEPTAYTKVSNSKNEILFENKGNTTKVINSGVAFIMTDILRTTVTKGIATDAATGNSLVAGKTGTTTDKYDAWFVGFTPQYSAALWIGNDVNIELSEGSAAAASLWSKIMRQVVSDKDKKTFPKSPDNIIQQGVNTMSGGYVYEYFIQGTQTYGYGGSSSYYNRDQSYSDTETVTICNDSGLLATSACPSTSTKTYAAGTAPTSYCYLHSGGGGDSGTGQDEENYNEDNTDNVVVEEDNGNSGQDEVQTGPDVNSEPTIEDQQGNDDNKNSKTNSKKKKTDQNTNNNKKKNTTKKR